MSFEPQALTVEGVKEAARKFYDMGKLTAQHPDPKKCRCVYQTSDGYRCAIGAALSDEVLKAYFDCHGESETIGIRSLKMQPFVTLPSDIREGSDISRIQCAHDEWAMSDSRQMDDEGLKHNFLHSINHPDANPEGGWVVGPAAKECWDISVAKE